MKTVKLFLMTIGIGLSSLLFYSCLENDDANSLGKFWIDVATIVPLSETTYFLRMDDGTTLWPAATSIPYYKPKENQRAMVNFTILSDSKDGYDHWVKVNRIDEFLTKEIAENKGDKNDSIYGTDPVGIEDVWVGDNYLNVYFKADFGGTKKHFVNLIPSDDENKIFEFRHNAYDDPGTGYLQGGLVAFNLSKLTTPDTESVSDSITITIKVKTFDGDKSYNVKFATGSTASNAKYFNDVFHEGLK